MKKTLLPLLFTGLIINTTGCSKESSSPDPSPSAPEVVILDPGTPTLSFPNNNEPCLESTAVNDIQSTVTFRWNTAPNVVSYDLEVTNLANNTFRNYSSTTNEKAVTLENSEPYSWQVTALGESGSQPAESERWKFYLAGPAEVNYAPFPAELTSPISGSTVSPVNGVITLQWSCTDADNDLASFSVYLDATDGSTLLETLEYTSSTTSMETTVASSTVYYWKVVAVDSEGNQSDSGVFTFRTN